MEAGLVPETQPSPLTSSVSYSIYRALYTISSPARNNEGAPLMIQFSNDIQLVNTDFLNNTNKIPAEADDGETSIEELYQSITTAGGFTYFNREAESNILIQVGLGKQPNDINVSKVVVIHTHCHTDITMYM